MTVLVQPAKIMDSVDKDILNALQHDARASFKQIAGKIGVSEATVFVRVKKLQEQGVIRSFKAILDPGQVGKPLTAIMLVKAEPKSLPGMLDEMKKIDDVYEIFDVTGEYYSILKIRTSNPDQLSKIIDKIGLIRGVAGTETIIVLRTVKEDVEIKV